MISRNRDVDQTDMGGDAFRISLNHLAQQCRGGSGLAHRVQRLSYVDLVAGPSWSRVDQRGEFCRKIMIRVALQGNALLRTLI
tara:strand:- start:818 stop:1066 length:249 start_codon:yes stop_codon:yes gene_type:complete